MNARNQGGFLVYLDCKDFPFNACKQGFINIKSILELHLVIIKKYPRCYTHDAAGRRPL